MGRGMPSHAAMPRTTEETKPNQTKKKEHKNPRNPLLDKNYSEVQIRNHHGPNLSTFGHLFATSLGNPAA